MRYIKVEFTSGFIGEAYQEVDSYGETLAFRDENGQALNLPSSTESQVIQDDVIPPFPVTTEVEKVEPETSDTIEEETIVIDSVTEQKIEEIVRRVISESQLEEVVTTPLT